MLCATSAVWCSVVRVMTSWLKGLWAKASGMVVCVILVKLLAVIGTDRWLWSRLVTWIVGMCRWLTLRSSLSLSSMVGETVVGL